MPTVTVPGVAHKGTAVVGAAAAKAGFTYSTINLQYNTQQTANFALSLLSQIYAAAGKHTLEVKNDAEKATGDTKKPTVKEWTLGDKNGKQNTGPTEGTVPAGFTGIIDAYTKQVSEIVGPKGGKNESVVAGGNMHFFTNGGSGTIISGQGNNLVNANATGDGNWTVIFDGGNNTVYANSGNFFIDDGNASTTGANSIFLGSGSDTVLSWGKDSIISGAGSSLVATFAAGALVWGNSGPSTWINFGGNDTFAGGTGGSDTVFAVNGGGLYFGGGSSLEFISNINTANTVVGGSGSTVIWGNTGSNGLYFVGTGAFTAVGLAESQTVVGGQFSSSAQLFGLNGANITLFSPVNGNVLIAGTGNVTLNGAGASGNDAYFAGAGAGSADSIVAGSGNNTLVAGPGSNTLVGGSGADLFQVNKAFAGGGTDFLVNWNANSTLLLSGYGAATSAGGLPSGATVSSSGGSEVLTLADGTKITFVGVSSVANSHIIGT